MIRKQSIAAATAIVALAAGPAFAQTPEAVDETARGGVKGALELIVAEETARVAADAAEADARAAGDAALQDEIANSVLQLGQRIDDESKEREIQDKIEAAHRAFEDAALIAAMTILSSADITLQALIDAEALARADADAALDVRVGVLEAGGGGSQKLLRTIVVSPVGPTPAENCVELRDALASITDNAADNPYVIKLEPGVYDCGFNGVAMKPFVDIEGSGEGITTVRGGAQTLTGASDAELRLLSVEASNTATDLLPGGADVTAIYFEDVLSFRIRNVTATAFSAVGLASGISGSGDVALNNVTAIARSDKGDADAMQYSSSPGGTAKWDELTLVSAVMAERRNMLNWFESTVGEGGTVTITGSTLQGDLALGANNRLIIVASQLDGAAVVDPGAMLNCFAAFDGFYEPLGPHC